MSPKKIQFPLILGDESLLADWGLFCECEGNCQTSDITGGAHFLHFIPKFPWIYVTKMEFYIMKCIKN